MESFEYLVLILGPFTIEILLLGQRNKDYVALDDVLLLLLLL